VLISASLITGLQGLPSREILRDSEKITSNFFLFEARMRLLG
jgi:hypothetical protein